jgi:bifunctional non-homologous end joining protein LigD
MLWRTSAPKRQPPGFIEPCIPTRADKPPGGPDWIHEIKHDGYRLIVRKKDDRVRLFTRRGFDWTDRFPLIRDAAAGLQSSALVIDGEAVCCDGDGVASFEKLQSQAHNDTVFLYAFDLLDLGGVDLRVEPLENRSRLQHLLAEVSGGGVQFNEHIDGDGATIFGHARKPGFEGIVSKHRKHPYQSGASKSWIKVKNPSAPGCYGSKRGRRFTTLGDATIKNGPGELVQTGATKSFCRMRV